MFIAKMTTRYPDFHGHGYYNFLMADTEDELNEKIEEVSHDFSHVKTVKTRFKSTEGLMKKYPSKSDLNNALFTEQEPIDAKV